MPRQEAATRGRNNPRRAVALGVWSALTLGAIVLLSWRGGADAATGEASGSLSPGWLCLGTTVAAALSLFAQLAFQSSRAASQEPSEGLGPFVITLLVPFVPAAVLSAGSSAVVTTYLGVLFAVTAAVAWIAGDEAGFFAAVARRTPVTRAGQNLSANSSSPHTVATANDTQAAVPRPEQPAFAATVDDAMHDDEPCDDELRDDALRDEVDGELPEEEIEEEAAGELPLNAGWHVPHEAHAGPPAPIVSQCLTRTRSQDQGERIEGTVRVEFAAGQKVAVVHVPFVPPLPRVPRIECHLMDGAELRVKVAAAHTYGMRIEARRTGSADAALSAEVSFAAHDEALRADAA